jgi:hypothetical protein
VLHRQHDNAVNLAAVGIAAMILAPGRFLREADQIGAGDVVVVPDLGPAHAREERLGVVRVNLLFRDAVGFLVVYPVQREPGV